MGNALSGHVGNRNLKHRCCGIARSIELRKAGTEDWFGIANDLRPVLLEDGSFQIGLILPRCMVYKDKGVDIDKFEAGEYEFDVVVFMNRINKDESIGDTIIVLDYFYDCKFVESESKNNKHDAAVIYDNLNAKYEWRVGSELFDKNLKEGSLGTVMATKSAYRLNQLTGKITRLTAELAKAKEEKRELQASAKAAKKPAAPKPKPKPKPKGK